MVNNDNIFVCGAGILLTTLTNKDMKTLKLISTATGFFLLLLMAARGDSEPRKLFAFLPFAVLFLWAGDAFKKWTQHKD